MQSNETYIIAIIGGLVFESITGWIIDPDQFLDFWGSLCFQCGINFHKGVSITETTERGTIEAIRIIGQEDLCTVSVNIRIWESGKVKTYSVLPQSMPFPGRLNIGLSALE